MYRALPTLNTFCVDGASPTAKSSQTIGTKSSMSNPVSDGPTAPQLPLELGKASEVPWEPVSEKESYHCVKLHQ